MDSEYLRYIDNVVTECEADLLVVPNYADLSEYEGLKVVVVDSGELYNAQVIEFQKGGEVVARARLP